MTTPNDNKDVPVIRVALQVGLGEQRALTFETYVGSTSDAKFICALLDKLNFCADRSKAKYDVELMEKQFEQETHLLNAMRDNLVLIDNHIETRRTTNGKKGINPLTSQEAKTRSDVETQIKDRTDRLKKLRNDIEAKQLVIKTGDIDGNVNSPANS